MCWLKGRRNGDSSVLLKGGLQFCFDRLGCRSPFLQQGSVVIANGLRVRMLRAEALKQDGQRPAHQRLGLGVQSLREQQRAGLTHQPGRRVDDAGLVSP